VELIVNARPGEPDTVRPHSRCSHTSPRTGSGEAIRAEEHPGIMCRIAANIELADEAEAAWLAEQKLLQQPGGLAS